MKTKTVFLAFFTLLFSFSAISQTVGNTGNSKAGATGSGEHIGKTGTHHKGVHKKHMKSNAGVMAPNRTSQTASTPNRPTDLSNSGSSNGTMASNNDPGKVTTSDKGKPGSSNAVVRKEKKK